jgi:hypothetical protein
MQQDSLTFKVTRAGRRYLHFLMAFNTADDEKITTFIHENFAPSFLETTSVADLLTWCKDVYALTGKIVMHKVYFSQEYYIIVIIKAIEGDKLYLHKMKIEEDEPHRIIELFHEETES